MWFHQKIKLKEHHIKYKYTCYILVTPFIKKIVCKDITDCNNFYEKHLYTYIYLVGFCTCSLYLCIKDL